MEVVRANKHYPFQVSVIFGVTFWVIESLFVVLNILCTYSKDWTCIFSPSVFKEKGQVLISFYEGPRDSLSLKSTSLNTLHSEILFLILSHLCQTKVSWTYNCSYITILNMYDKVNPHFIQNKQKHYKALWSISF